MQIAQIMSAPVATIAPDASLDDVIRLMDERGVRHLPVVDGDHLIGLISDRDVLEATGWLPERLRSVFLSDRKGPRTAGEIARSPIMTAQPSDNIMTLTVEAVVQGMGCLPVLSGGRVVGIVTETDLLRAYCEACRSAPDGALGDSYVERYMTRSVRAIEHGATLGDALRTMRELGVRHLPVVQAGNLVGIVSDRDIRRELGCGRSEDYPLVEVMTTAPVVATPRTRLSDAVGRMLDARISSLPVLLDSELVGILTALDVLDPCMAHLGNGPGGDDSVVRARGGARR